MRCCRYHRYAQRVLSNVSLAFSERQDVPDIAFCAVDLDDTPELSTYSHFNTIDVMYFYKHLILNGVRFPGSFSIRLHDMYAVFGLKILYLALVVLMEWLFFLVSHP